MILSRSLNCSNSNFRVFACCNVSCDATTKENSDNLFSNESRYPFLSGVQHVMIPVSPNLVWWWYSPLISQPENILSFTFANVGVRMSTSQLLKWLPCSAYLTVSHTLEFSMKQFRTISSLSICRRPPSICMSTSFITFPYSSLFRQNSQALHEKQYRQPQFPVPQSQQLYNSDHVSVPKDKLSHLPTMDSIVMQFPYKSPSILMTIPPHFTRSHCFIMITLFPFPRIHFTSYSFTDLFITFSTSLSSMRYTKTIQICSMLTSVLLLMRRFARLITKVASTSFDI